MSVDILSPLSDPRLHPTSETSTVQRPKVKPEGPYILLEYSIPLVFPQSYRPSSAGR
jgi:hypothetical protein